MLPGIQLTITYSRIRIKSQQNRYFFLVKAFRKVPDEVRQVTSISFSRKMA